jgi:hypothetical protein
MFWYVVAGTYIFKYKQSSLVSYIETDVVFCMHGDGILDSRIPVHDDGGCGGRNRREPIGGCANGIPKYCIVEFVRIPRKTPCFVVTKISS